ncbi:c-type cytochrome [Aestuariivirga sp.]|uniref:c-type cytochrome n=1 Tax=Aestuariivirga sp. TaxID=2650926 RepID=UPI00391BDFAD
MRVAAQLLLPVCAVVLAGCEEPSIAPARELVRGDSSAGKAAILNVSCGICHVIPGVPGAHGAVGPSLDGFARRSLIAGIAPNRPALLVRWVRDAPSISPSTGMPAMPLSDEEAVDVAAFLYTLR